MEGVLNNPEMMKSMQEMMSNISPEDLSAMSKQAGLNITPEQVHLLLHMLVGSTYSEDDILQRQEQLHLRPCLIPVV